MSIHDEMMEMTSDVGLFLPFTPGITESTDTISGDALSVTRSGDLVFENEDGFYETAVADTAAVGKHGLFHDGAGANLFAYSEDISYFSANTISTTQGTSSVHDIELGRVIANDSSSMYRATGEIPANRTFTVSFLARSYDQSSSYSPQIELNSSGVETHVKSINVTKEVQRFYFTEVFDNDQTGELVFNLNTLGNEIDIEIGGFQLEESPYPSSYMPTNGSAVSRTSQAADSSGNGVSLDISTAHTDFQKSVGYANENQGPEMVSDGQFETFIDYLLGEDQLQTWEINTQSGSADWYVVSDSPVTSPRSIYYNQQSAPRNATHHRIGQYISNFQQNKAYQLQFSAKTDETSAAIQVNDFSLGIGGLNEDVLISNTWKRYTLNFTTNEYANGVFFDLGKDSASKYITDVRLKRIGCVMDLQPNGINHKQWMDSSENNHHADVNALPVGLSSDDIDTFHTKSSSNFSIYVPGGYQVETLTVIGGDSDITISVGTTEGGSEIVTDKVITAGTETVLEINQYTSDDSNIYISSLDWVAELEFMSLSRKVQQKSTEIQSDDSLTQIQTPIDWLLSEIDWSLGGDLYYVNSAENSYRTTTDAKYVITLKGLANDNDVTQTVESAQAEVDSDENLVFAGDDWYDFSAMSVSEGSIHFEADVTSGVLFSSDSQDLITASAESPISFSSIANTTYLGNSTVSDNYAQAKLRCLLILPYELPPEKKRMVESVLSQL